MLSIVVLMKALASCHHVSCNEARQGCQFRLRTVDDLWRYDLKSRGGWRELEPRGTLPAARAHMGAKESATRVLLWSPCGIVAKQQRRTLTCRSNSFDGQEFRHPNSLGKEASMLCFNAAQSLLQVDAAHSSICCGFSTGQR